MIGIMSLVLNSSFSKIFQILSFYINYNKNNDCFEGSFSVSKCHETIHMVWKLVAYSCQSKIEVGEHGGICLYFFAF